MPHQIIKEKIMAKKTAQSVISSYRKRQKSGSTILRLLALILIVAGVTLVIVWAVGRSGSGGFGLFSTKTPTPTETPTPTPVTPTPTASNTATITNTPTITMTPTASGPFEYVVQEEDNCTTIAKKFDVEVGVLLFLNSLDSTCIIRVGDTILIPAPGQELPTATPLPTDIYPGTIIDYTVKSGDDLATLADKFRSTVDRIKQETNRYRRKYDLPEIEDNTDLYVGDLLKIPVYIVTAKPTATATRTMTPSPTP